ncbi:MAG: hypothetical protein ACFB50_02645 [Rubrobacteraceae bacterium]
MLRNVLAVLAGYAVMVALVAGTTAALARLWPASSENDGSPTPAYTAVNLAYSSLFGAAGGYVASALAHRPSTRPATALAGLVLVLGAAYSVQSAGGKQPNWYLALLPALSSCSVIAGGYANTRSRRKEP